MEREKYTMRNMDYYDNFCGIMAGINARHIKSFDECHVDRYNLYREYGRAPPNQRAYGEREGVVGSNECYTIQLFTTLADDPPIIYNIHNKADGPSDGNL